VVGKKLFGLIVVTTVYKPVATTNGGAKVLACLGIYIPGKGSGFVAAGAGITAGYTRVGL
jgi:hypothetical protein